MLVDLESQIKQNRNKEKQINAQQQDLEQKENDYRRLTDSFYRQKKEFEDRALEQEEHITSLEAKVKEMGTANDKYVALMNKQSQKSKELQR